MPKLIYANKLLRLQLKRMVILLFATFACYILHAQHKVRFIVKETTMIHHDSIYVTGTFNGWDSLANKDYLMHADGTNRRSIELTIPAGPMRYKFTRGNWFTVEKQFSGSELSDRTVYINRDTTLADSIAGWRDEMIRDKMLRLQEMSSDTDRIDLQASIAANYAFFAEYYNADSALFYAQNALQLYQKINSSEEYKTWTQSESSYQIFRLQETLASLMHALGNYPKSLEIRVENLKLAEKNSNKFVMAETLRSLTNDYMAMKDYPNTLKYGRLMDSVLGPVSTTDRLHSEQSWNAKNIIANAFYHMGDLDSALYYATKMQEIKPPGDEIRGYLAYNDQLLADIYNAKGETRIAYSFYKSSIDNALYIHAEQLIGGCLAGIAMVFKKEGRPDSALIYARAAMDYFRNNKTSIQAWGENTNSYIADLSPLLAELYYSANKPDSAYKYLRLSIALKDSLYNSDKIRQFLTLSFNESARHQQLDQQSREARQQYETKVKMYGLLTILIGILVLALILYRNNKQKQKANAILLGQKKEIEDTLGELKRTQSKLIQSEKMASLGELTAGIAHEIQNPLNFVNNFSEVNSELMDELSSAADQGNLSEIKALAKTIRENEQKISHHGHRADAIVKGMLQHSRSNTGVKEPTDINALTDEYLRLCYHGLRAKDKTFNATIKSSYDNSIGSVKIIPQEVGRVVLNIMTNAFYAVNEKKKSILNGASPDTPYEPTVSVSTNKDGNKVAIHIKDNGNGISQKIIDKIFQPFFTTKPTGQGTGLGLSLSYDIIQAHQGQLKVISIEGEGAEFIIEL